MQKASFFINLTEYHHLALIKILSPNKQGVADVLTTYSLKLCNISVSNAHHTYLPPSLDCQEHIIYPTTK